MWRGVAWWSLARPRKRVAFPVYIFSSAKRIFTSSRGTSEEGGRVLHCICVCVTGLFHRLINGFSCLGLYYSDPEKTEQQQKSNAHSKCQSIHPNVPNINHLSFPSSLSFERGSAGAFYSILNN